MAKVTLAMVGRVFQEMAQEAKLSEYQETMRAINREWGKPPIYGPYNYDPRPVYGPPSPPPEFKAYDKFSYWVGIGFWNLEFQLFWDDSNYGASQTLTRDQWRKLRDYITEVILKDDYDL